MQLLFGKGFGQEMISSYFQGGIFSFGIHTGDHDDLDIGQTFPDIADNINAQPIRQTIVQYYEGWYFFFQELPGCRQGLDMIHLHALIVQYQAQ